MGEEMNGITLAEIFSELDENEFANNTGYTPVPAGPYDANIDKMTFRKSKDENGDYLNIKFKIVAPSHIGAAVFHNITTNHTNPKAKAIGLKKLKELCIAAGLDFQKNRLTDLCGRTVKIEVVQKESPNWGMRNEVIKVMPTENIPF